MKQVGVSQKALLFNGDGNFLILLRGKTAPVAPLTWDLPGGDLDFGEDPLESIVREISEETSLEPKKLSPFDIEAHINDDGDHWVTICYVGSVTKSDVKISWEHDKYEWVALADFKTLESRPKIVRFVEKYYRNLK